MGCIMRSPPFTIYRTFIKFLVKKIAQGGNPVKKESQQAQGLSPCMVLSKGETGMGSKTSWPSLLLLSYESRCATGGRRQSKTQLQAQAIAAAINEGKHPSDAATDGSWTAASAQASPLSVCSFAIALGGMMSGHNFPAESLIHP